MAVAGLRHALSHSAIMTETVAARNRTTRGIVLLAVVVLAWGTMWPVNKALLAYMTPVWSIALRTYISVARRCSRFRSA